MHNHQYPNLLSKDGETYFFPELFTTSESDRYIQILSKELILKQEPIIMFGKQVMQPRLTAWFGDEGKSYRYSGITMYPQPWTNLLLEIKNRIEIITGTIFNSALVNYYRDGKDSMGWHRDNEKDLGTDPVIASVSFGATRKFLLRHVKDKLFETLTLTHGSLLLMRGSTQHYWQHAVPKTMKETGPRLNITFRVII